MIVSNPHPNIIVYDDVFNWQQNHEMFDYVYHAPYTLGWSDNYNESEQYFHCGFDSNMWKNRQQHGPINNILEPLYNSEPFRIHNVDDNKISKSVINCDTLSDSHTVHTHRNEDVLLYYVNTEWKDGWGGETFFYDNNGKEIVYTCPYTPNRMVYFRGDIVHRFNGPSKDGPKFRFSISTFIERN